MNKQKQTYLSPETETLVVRFEESVLNSNSPGGYSENPNTPGNPLTEDTGFGF